MADRPTLFSGLMVRALLDDRKTTTRRVMKHPRWADPDEPMELADSGLQAIAKVSGCFGDVKTPYAVGDRLWVKETWAPLSAIKGNDPGAQALCDRGVFRADGSVNEDEIDRWRPSIFMPRDRSRITLTVTDVKIERLHDISEEDAIAEGVYRGKASGRYADSYAVMAIAGEWFASARSWYRDLNPWVVAPTFTVIKSNIDKVAHG